METTINETDELTRKLIEFRVDAEYVYKQIEAIKCRVPSADNGDFIYAVLQRFGKHTTPFDYSEMNRKEYKSGLYPGVLSIYAIDHIIRAFKETFRSFEMHSVIPTKAMSKFTVSKSGKTVFEAATTIADLWIEKLAFIHECTNTEVIADGVLFGTFSGIYSWRNPEQVHISPLGYKDIDVDIQFRITGGKDKFSYVDGNPNVSLTHLTLGMYVIPEKYMKLYDRIKTLVLNIINFMYDQCERNAYTDIYPVEYKVKDLNKQDKGGSVYE